MADPVGHAKAAFDLGQGSRQLFDTLPDALLVVDAAGTILTVNRQAERLFGYGDREMVGQAIELQVPEEARAKHVQRRRSLLASPRPRPMGTGVALRARRKDGSTFPADISLGFLDAPGGGIVIAAVRDLTERSEVLEALARQQADLAHAREELRLARLLRASQDQLRAVIAKVPIVLFTTNPAGRLDFVSGRGLEAIGLLPQDLLGRPLESLFPEAAEVGGCVRRALAGEACRAVATVNGAWFDLWLAPWRCGDGGVAGLSCVMGVASDVTEHKHLEAELTAARQELEARVRERTKSLTTALEALKVKEARLAEAERIAGAGHWAWDVKNDHILWSDGASRVFGSRPTTGQAWWRP